jgi:hypothetical protein
MDPFLDLMSFRLKSILEKVRENNNYVNNDSAIEKELDELIKVLEEVKKSESSKKVN